MLRVWKIFNWIGNVSFNSENLKHELIFFYVKESLDLFINKMTVLLTFYLRIGWFLLFYLISVSVSQNFQNNVFLTKALLSKIIFNKSIFIKIF